MKIINIEVWIEMERSNVLIPYVYQLELHARWRELQKQQQNDYQSAFCTSSCMYIGVYMPLYRILTDALRCYDWFTNIRSGPIRFFAFF